MSGSWQACVEGLYDPFERDKVRPFVFDHDLAKGRDDVVLVHLNYKLAQMDLRLLRAEVWSVEGRKHLHRVAARLVPDTALKHPAIVAHARLVVIGGDCHRLHEEIITASGHLREGRFSRFGTLREMQEALAAATNAEPAAHVKAVLADLWPKNVEALRQALDARMKERTSGLEKLLAERAKQETDDIFAILIELRRAIEAQLDDPDYQQAFLPGLAPTEREQMGRGHSSHGGSTGGRS